MAPIPEPAGKGWSGGVRRMLGVVHERGDRDAGAAS